MDLQVRHAPNDSIGKHKARFVRRHLHPWLDMHLLRQVISIALEMRWRIYQMAVKIAFLSGIIDKEVYIEEP